jgi:hypothetical protein
MATMFRWTLEPLPKKRGKSNDVPVTPLRRIEEAEIPLYLFSTSAIVLFPTSCPSCYATGKEHRYLVNRRQNGLEDLEKRKISCFCWD